MEEMKEKLAKMSKEELNLRKEFLTKLFEKKVVILTQAKGGQQVYTKIMATDKALDDLIQQAIQRGTDEDSAYSDAMYFAWLAILNFDIKGGSTWEQVVSGEDMVTYRKLLKSIKTRVKFALLQCENAVTTRKKNGQGEYQKTIYKMKFDSLNKQVDVGEGEPVSLMDLVTDGYFSVKPGYEKSFFLQWFHENKEKILTQSQVKLLEKMSACSYDKGGVVSSKEFQKCVGLSTNRIKEYLGRIAARTLKAFNKEFPSGVGKTFREMEIEKEVALLQEFMAIVENAAPEVQNQELSNWVVENLDNDFVEKIVYDHFLSKDIMTIVNVVRGERKQIPSAILYKLYELIESRLNELLEELEKNKLPQAEVLETIGDRKTKEKNKKRKERYKEFVKSQPVVVYQLDFQTGEMTPVRVEKPTPIKTTKARIVTVDAFGAEHDLNGSDFSW